MSQNFKIPFWGSFFTLIGVFILCGLGIWQIQRLEWKNDVLEKIEAAKSTENPKKFMDQNFKDGDFIYGRIEGRLLTAHALLLGPRTRDGIIGNDLIVPVKTDKGTAFVNLGFTAKKLKDLDLRHLENKKFWAQGLGRAPDWNSFTPENEPEKDLWYKADLNQIATAKNLKNPMPFIIYADETQDLFAGEFPNPSPWNINNNHAQYAAFWFSMAGILIAIYILRFFVNKKTIG